MAIAFDSASTQLSSSSANLSWNHTVTGGSPYVKVNVTARTALGGVSSVSFGATGMTQVGSAQTFASSSHKAFELVNPPTGTTTITVNCTGLLRISAVAVSYSGVNQGTPTSGVTQVIGASTVNPRVTVSSTVGDLIVDCASMEAATGGGTLTVDGAGETERGNVTTASGSLEEVSAAGDVAGASSSMVSWLKGGNKGSGGIIAWSIAAAPPTTASGAGNYIRRRHAA